MSRFSQFLIDRKLLMQEQLEQALQHQAVYGARLGTNLVELRFLTVDRLAECLSEFHKVPLPPRQWLERPKRNAVERVTRPLVERIRFIPMRLENNNILHAAVLDPNDPRTLDDLRFATGCKIQPYVLPEIWMHDWLFTLFKLPRGIRHIESEDAQRELEKPAQSYDFQAAQAAQAARAAAAPASAPRSGPPAEGQPRAPGDRTSFQGAPVARGVTMQGQPVRAPGQGAPIAERPQPNPNRVTMQGGADRQAIPPTRFTAQGTERSPVVPVRTTQLGAAPAAPARVTQQGTERSPAAPARVTAQGTAQSPLARPTAQGVDRLSSLGERPVGLGGPPAPFVEKDAELFPLATPVPSPGASVRPPPISIKSLSEVNPRMSLPSVTGISSGGFAPPVIPAAPAMWEPEAGTSPALQSIREALRPAPEPERAPEPPPKAAVAPEPRPAELSDLEYSLRDVTDREQLIEISFKIASRFARVVALFLVHRGMVQGVRCLDDGETRDINGVLMPLESASMLTHAANQFVPFRIDPREKPVDARVQQLLTARAVNEVALFPIVMKQRTVNLLYAAHGNEPLGAVAFGALSVLAEQMGAAYGQLILNRKGSGS